ncbi:MAG: beta-galactosidase, partial [Candidatus Sulfotelmatobacter sp.]
MPFSFLCRAVWCVLLVASASAQTAAPLPASIPTQIPGQNAILMGTAWYPEQWPESRWEEDLRMMESADVKVVRIAEFAWSRMEPSEGHYDFDWLERAINLAGKHHIVSV